MKITDTAVQAAAKCYAERVVSINDTFSSLAREMLTAALPHLPLGFEVKQLEWDGDTANTPFGDYDVYRDADDAMVNTPICASHPDGVIGHFPNETEAKAAAKADFERRVRECIVAKPVDVAPLDANYILYPINHLPSDSNGKCGWTDIANAIDESYRRIRALSAEPAQGEQWLPIETAPKDGTPLILLRNKHEFAQGERVIIAHWNDKYDSFVWANFFDIYADDIDDVDENGKFVFDIFKSRDFTHWMPLPAAPTTEAGRAALSQGGGK